MIFGESTTINTPVKESRYELGIEGALMHVYENECNFNAIMKSAALSEMKYYNETGGDLFIQEASAGKGLIAKIKAFFNKAIEKIKSIFAKFMAKINQFTMDNNKFVKKYENELMRKDLTDFEFDGYVFNDNGSWGTIKVESSATVVAGKLFDLNGDTVFDNDLVEDIKEENRGKIVGESNKIDSSEFTDKLKEILYGDKDTLKINTGDLRNRLNNIKNTKKYIGEVEKTEKDAVKVIEDAASGYEKDATKLYRSAPSDNDKELAKQNNKIKTLTQRADVLRAYANDLTIMFGAKAKAAADSCKQDKAICVKALSYKHESTGVYGEDDIFAGVQIV